MTGPAVPATPDLTAQIEGITNKIFSGANWRNEVERTVRRNVKLLAKNKELEAENTSLKAAAPKDGAKTISKEDAELLETYKALGKPAELKTVVKEHGEFKVKVQEHEEEESFKTAAKALEFENIPALTRWLKREGLHLEFREEAGRDEEGARITKKVPFVRPKTDDKAPLESLDAYITREVPEFVDTFKSAPAHEEGEEDDGEERERPAPATGGIRIPATRSAGNGSGMGREKKILQKMEEDAKNDRMYAL